MFAGEASFNGLGSLILCEVPMNTFSYGQALLIYKEDCKKVKNNKKLFFEQDGALAYTSKNKII
jgi:hypothetical protein